ncbi:MAG: tRNA dihydrouridine synthase DusB [bacterium]|nr:tRNA dihydrouridine synthase DusB [bacterium]
MQPGPDKQSRTDAMRALIRGGGAAAAPMAGITDGPFRRICRRMGSLFVTTEFLSSEGLRRGGKRTVEMAAFIEEERPLGIQLFGSKPEAMAEGATAAARMNPDFLDLNFGCPVRKVVRVSGGSAVMKDLGLMAEITQAVVEAVDIPVSVKMRSGWDESSINAPAAAQVAEAAGAAWLTVHGRTRAQLYAGKADLQVIRRVRESVSVPVIGNGDVVDAASYERMLNLTGVDMVLVGRGVIGNPWIFAEIEAARGGVPWRAPTSAERVEQMIDHLDDRIEEMGEHRGVVGFRFQMSQYLKGMPGVSALRRELFAIDDPVDVRRLAREFASSLGS